MASPRSAPGPKESDSGAHLRPTGDPAAESVQLTDLEAIVLTQIEKGAGVSAYEVMKVIGRSPVGALSASPGAVYPVVKRLRARGMLTAAASGARSREALTLTDAGRQGLAAWASVIAPEDVLPHEPLLSKAGAFMVLPKAQRLKALFAARTAIDERLDRLAELLAETTDADAVPALEGAQTLLRARRKWVEAFLLQVAED